MGVCCEGSAGAGAGYCTCNSRKGYDTGSKRAKEVVRLANEWQELVEGGACVDPWEGLALYQQALHAVLDVNP